MLTYLLFSGLGCGLPYLILRKKGGAGRIAIAWFVGFVVSFGTSVGFLWYSEEVLHVPPLQANAILAPGLWCGLIGPALAVILANRRRRKTIHSNGATTAVVALMIMGFGMVSAIAQEDSEVCQSYGARLGTPEYQECRSLLRQTRSQDPFISAMAMSRMMSRFQSSGPREELPDFSAHGIPVPTPAPEPRVRPRSEMHCVTIGMGDGDSMTDCF